MVDPAQGFGSAFSAHAGAGAVGCDCVEGFLFAPPLPAADAAALLVVGLIERAPEGPAEANCWTRIDQTARPTDDSTTQPST
jgi:hypothetical protein